MICVSCKIDKDSKDYYKNEKCYKCVYIEKIKAKKKNRLCKICNKKITDNRWAYCSDNCSDKAHYEDWTRCISFQSFNHKNHPWRNH